MTICPHPARIMCRNCSPREVVHAAQVDGQDVFPLAGRHRPDWSARPDDPGVVHHGIEPPITLGDRIDHRSDGPLVADIDDKCRDRSTERQLIGLSSRQRGRIDIGRGNEPARAAQALRDRRSDPAAAPVTIATRSAPPAAPVTRHRPGRRQHRRSSAHARPTRRGRSAGQNDRAVASGTPGHAGSQGCGRRPRVGPAPRSCRGP